MCFAPVGPAQADFGEDGWVRAGSVGDVPVLATAIVPGTRSLTSSGCRSAWCRGPARRLAIDPVPRAARPPATDSTRRPGAQRRRRRAGRRVIGSSSAPAVARVGRDGLLEARAAGRATIRAAAAGLRAEVPVEVVAAGPAALTIEPSSAQGAAGQRGPVHRRGEEPPAGDRGPHAAWTSRPAKATSTPTARSSATSRGRTPSPRRSAAARRPRT